MGLMFKQQAEKEGRCRSAAKFATENEHSHFAIISSFLHTGRDNPKSLPTSFAYNNQLNHSYATNYLLQDFGHCCCGRPFLII